MIEKQNIKVKVLHCIFKDSIKNGDFKKKERNYETYKRRILRDREIDTYIRSYMDKDELVYIDDFSDNVSQEERKSIKHWIEIVNEKVDDGTIRIQDLQNVTNLLKKCIE